MLGLVDRVFTDPLQECSPERTPGPERGGFVGCLVRGHYARLPGERIGQVYLAYQYPPDDLSLDGTTPVTDWLRSPLPTMDGELQLFICEEWTTLAFALPEVPQAIGCEDEFVDILHVRVVAATEQVLVFVDLDGRVLDITEPEPGGRYLRELARETARRMLAEVAR